MPDTDEQLLDDLLLLTFLPQKGERGRFGGLLGKALRSVLGDEPVRTVEREGRGRLAASGRMQPGLTARADLSKAGREAAAAFLGVPALPKPDKWNVFERRYLVAKALGLMPGLATPKLDHLATAERLCLEVIRQHHALTTDPVPSSAAVRGKLGWKLLVDPLPAEVIDRASALGSFNSTVVVFDALCFAAAGLTTVKKDKGPQVLAAKLLGTPPFDYDALRQAILRRWLQGRLSTGRALVQEEPNGFGDLASFAASVQITARRMTTGRYTDSLVFISHLWRAHRSDAGGGLVSLSEFKTRLLNAYRADHIVLSKADMPQTLDPTDLAESTIRDRSVDFVFVRTT